MDNMTKVGKIVKINDDIYRIKTPFNLQRGSVNSYLIRDRSGGWVVLDPGYSTDICRGLWQEAMDMLGFGFENISLILNTHFHTDHAGLAGWFERNCSAPIYMSPADVISYRSEWQDESKHLDIMVEYMSHHGLSSTARIEEMRQQMHEIGTHTIDMCTRFLPLADGDRFPVKGGYLRAIAAPGHATGQLIFAFDEQKYLFSADMLLPISFTPVTLRSYGDANPVGSIIRTLRSYIDGGILDSSYTCLPGHGWAFDDPVEHSRQALEHFISTAQWYVERCRDCEVCAYTIGEELKVGNPRKFHLLMSEAMAYLTYIHDLGLAERTERDGVYYYRTINK